MSRYVIEILSEDLARPTFDEWVAKLRELPPIGPSGFTGADLVREAREERGKELDARLSSSSTRRSRSRS